MDMDDHNNPSISDKRVATMRDLCDLILQSKLPPPRKAELCSAVKTVNRLTGHGVMDQAANLLAILHALEQISPAMAGLSVGAYANVKARVRAAFKLARPEMVSVRNVELSPPWRALGEAMAKREQLLLSRFLRFGTFSGWQPEDICDAHIERYRSFLDATSAVTQPGEVIRNTIRAWNHVARLLPTYGLNAVTPPAPKRTGYWIPRATWPEALNADVDAFLDSLLAPSFLTKSKIPKLKPATVDQYESVLITVVSALVALGDPLTGMTSLGLVVSPSKIERVMVFLHERYAGRVTSGMEIIAARSRRAATWCKLSDEELAACDDLLGRLGRDAEPRRGMTQKNQTLVERLDDPQFRDLFLILPITLMQSARKTHHAGFAASSARTAVAIELLQTCSMRRANLASLKLGKNIKKTGLGKDAFWVIEFEAEDVKNARPLRFTLPKESAELLEDYLENWRPYYCAAPNDWLFPSPGGRPPQARSLAHDISRKSKQALGVAVTPHQFRHLSASIYVANNPNNLAVASEDLGHASLDTTRSFYLRSQQKAASRVYQNKLGLDRALAVERTTKISRRRRATGKLKEGDLL
jgi:integrase